MAAVEGEGMKYVLLGKEGLLHCLGDDVDKNFPSPLPEIGASFFEQHLHLDNSDLRSGCAFR